MNTPEMLIFLESEYTKLSSSRHSIEYSVITIGQFIASIRDNHPELYKANERMIGNEASAFLQTRQAAISDKKSYYEQKKKEGYMFDRDEMERYETKKPEAEQEI